MNIVIIGAGMMGSAVSFPARENGCSVRLVGTPLDGEIISALKRDAFHPTLKRRLPDGVEFFAWEELERALPGADIAVSGVSSFGVDWFADAAIPRLPAALPVLGVTKGMLDTPEGELLTFPELYEAKYPGRSFCAVGGPCTSYELADRDPTEVCFCGRDAATLRFLRSAFECSFYHVSLSLDVRGVECAVAMKNAYALGVTLAVGMAEKREGREGALHYNSQAALFGQSVREMSSLLRLCGGGGDMISLGAGDLYVTVFGGRTRLIGRLLGAGLPFEEAVARLEGITLESLVIASRTARAVGRLVERGRARREDFPLLFCVDGIINGGKPAEIPWESFELRL